MQLMWPAGFLLSILAPRQAILILKVRRQQHCKRVCGMPRRFCSGPEGSVRDEEHLWRRDCNQAFPGAQSMRGRPFSHSSTVVYVKARQL